MGPVCIFHRHSQFFGRKNSFRRARLSAWGYAHTTRAYYSFCSSQGGGLKKIRVFVSNFVNNRFPSHANTAHALYAYNPMSNIVLNPARRGEVTKNKKTVRKNETPIHVAQITWWVCTRYVHTYAQLYLYCVYFLELKKINHKKIESQMYNRPTRIELAYIYIYYILFRYSRYAYFIFCFYIYI